jgi:hypothetical protein
MKILTKEEEAAHYKYVPRTVIEYGWLANEELVLQSRAEPLVD